jgi:hypothetical protein
MEPDWDDMIEDAIEASYEEPLAYDEAYLDEMMDEDEDEAPVVTTEPATLQTPSIRQEVFQNEGNDEEMEEAASASVRELFSRNRAAVTRADEFAFERYDIVICRTCLPSSCLNTLLHYYLSFSLFECIRYHSNSNWRQSAASNSPGRGTMHATGWKSNHPQLKSSNNLSFTSCYRQQAADSQLLSFLQPRTTTRKLKTPSAKLEHPVPGVTCRPMTFANGKRLYWKHTTKAPHLDSAIFSDCSILGVSMTELMRRVESVRRQKEHDHQRQTERRLDERSSATQSTSTGYLWVDKHAPLVFAHLLSDERTNRDVLRSIRAWDPYVFGKPAPPRPDFLQKKTTPVEKTSDKRPDVTSRVILLSGPPGVG